MVWIRRATTKIIEILVNQVMTSKMIPKVHIFSENHILADK